MRYVLVFLAASMVTVSAFGQSRTAPESVKAAPDAKAISPTMVTLARYSLDGNANDASGGAKHATVTGGSWQLGFDGTSPGALAFDDKTKLKIGEYGGHFDATNFTVSMRIKTNLQGGTLLQIAGGRWCHLQNLIEKSNFNTNTNLYKVSYKLQLGACIPQLGAGYLVFSYDGADGKHYSVGLPYQLTNPATVMNNQWTEVTIGYDGTNMRLLVNGVEKHKLAAAPPVATDGGIVLGKAYAGLIDDVRFTKTVFGPARSLTMAR